MLLWEEISNCCCTFGANKGNPAAMLRSRAGRCVPVVASLLASQAGSSGGAGAGAGRASWLRALSMTPVAKGE